MLTIGVEEEFLLLVPDGAPAPAAPDLLRLTRDAAGPGQIKPELMTFQIEAVTGVCGHLHDVEDQLTRLRRTLREAGHAVGVWLVAAGSSPFVDPGLVMLTDVARYRRLAAGFPVATAAGGTCACHVHVGMDDRDLGVQVLNRLRPWLPTLLAMTGNSPHANGTDTGWDSVRYCRQLSWPTFRPPPAVVDAHSYDRTVTRLMRRGVALDPRSVYFLARLSPRYPTLEVRVADACLTVQDAVLLAGVVRGLVTTLAADVRLDRPSVVPAASGSLRRQLLAAAHHGLASATVSPRTAPSTPASPAPTDPQLSRVVDAILPALEAADDAETVLPGLDRLQRLGTGAQQQRALKAATRSRVAFVSALADVTAPLSAVPAAR